MEFFLIWILKIFGVLWVIGGIFVIRQSWVSIYADKSIAALEAVLDELEGADKDAGAPADRGRSYWLLVGGVLTVICGLGLLFPVAYVLVPLAILVLHQGLYAWRQAAKVRKAATADAAEGAAMSPQARNGALMSLGVFALFLSLVWTGVIT